MIDEIQVTQESIDHGICGEPSNCALALAVSAHYDCDCAIDGDGIEIYNMTYDGSVKSFGVCDELWQWITIFDGGQKTEPITVCIDHDNYIAYIKGEDISQWIDNQ